jgi:hypothetical protein
MDLLASVKLKHGGEEFVLCHLELQGEAGGDLPLRMYKYKEAIHLLYDKEPAGIAVITTRRPGGEKTAYRSNVYGVKASYEYKNYSVPDIPDGELLSGENRIGLILYAAKCAGESGSDERKKFGYLRQISGMWNERGWEPEDKRLILLTVDYLLRLKDEGLKDAYASHLRHLEMKEGDKEMYQSMIEEVARKEYREMYQSMIEEVAMKEAMEKGMEKGLEKGMEKGLKKGKQEMAFEMAKNLLARGISPDIIAESSGLSRDDVCALMN